MTSKTDGVKRYKTGCHAVTPNTHGVTTAYAEYVGKPISLLDYTYGVNHGVNHNQSHTPVTAIHSMA